MQQILNFIIRNKNFLFFLLLFGFSIGVTIQSHLYSRSSFINSANFVTGGVYSTLGDVSNYFSLREYNNRLLEENKQLRNQVHNAKGLVQDSAVTDSASVLFKYNIRTAEVLKNSYSAAKNYLLLNVGADDGITQDMGVITSQGIVGIVERTSKHYATVQSVLNENSKINAGLLKTNHFGSLVWNYKPGNGKIQLIEIPKEANVQKGDTIITRGMSAIFPRGIPIGVVDDYKLTASGNDYIINVALFNDMTNVGYVYIIENTEKQEIETLLEDTAK